MMDGQIHKKKSCFCSDQTFQILIDTDPIKIYKILLDTAPKELLGFLVKLNIVADSIQPKGSREGKDVRDGQGDEESDTEGLLVLVADSELLLPLNTAVEALGDGGVWLVSVESAEGQIPNTLLIPFVLTPEDNGTGVDEFLNSRKSAEECHCQDQDFDYERGDR